jgi:fumarate reductase flavoprotein subunit
MTKASVPDKWDHETDVLIVGAGTAGIPAGLAALEAGAKATVLELTTMTGGSGNLILAGAAFAGTEWQKKAGIEDSPQLLYKDGVEIAEGMPEIWRVYADNQIDTFNWLMSIGAPPERDELMMPPGHRVTRLHFYVGAEAMQKIEQEAKRKNLEILFNHRALRTITDPKTGRVLGLKVKVKDKLLNFKAKRAVIIATGGFGRNREMLKEYGQRFIDCVPLMAPGHLGDGLKMGLDLGAATKDIGHSVVASLPACTETKADRATTAIFMGGILVNVHGKRFYDESCPKGYYGNLTDAAMDEPEGLFWIVYDSKTRSIPIVGDVIGKCKEFKADTFEELAKISGTNVKGLTETVAKYNEDIESEGYDTVLGRKHLVSVHGEPIPLDTPPYYAVKCTTSITSFKGGLKVNTRCQVQTNYDEVIPGLYAVGEVAGGLFGKGIYLGGTMWPAAMTFGRLTGRSAAFDSPWE